MKPVRWAWFWAALLAPGIGVAEQMQRFGDFEAHYVVFPSTFVQSEIAHQYGLRRGPGLAIVNVSVLDASGTGVACAIAGHSKNLLDQVSPLTFKEVREGDAVYYLAEVRHADQEVLRFSLTITPLHETKAGDPAADGLLLRDQRRAAREQAEGSDAEPFTLNFQQRLYVEE